MSILLADIDATCAALGYSDGEKYQAEPDAIQGLKHLIWILRRDLDNHEYRRHLGRSKVLQTDLVYMLPDYIEDEEFADVLIRLLVILTSPTLLLYRDGPPTDNHGRKVFLELIDILQGYKNAFIRDKVWAALFGVLKKGLAIDWAVRSEEQSLLIERILVLIRNVLQIPANPEAEGRADNDASLHDQVIWALHQSGILDLVLFVISSPDEHQFHLHGLEILCLLFREQTAESLADASLQRSQSEKQRDEQELIAARRREKARLMAKPPPGRHSRFGGTYVIRNLKSVSDRDIICHQPLERVVSIDFDREKQKQKRSFRHVREVGQVTRRSAFSVRLCLREYCIEVLRSAYNTLVRQVRRVLERNTGSTNHDDSYLLWAIRFFMEFNRLSGLKLELVSESLSVQCFHWVLTRMQHDMDMIVSDKKQARLWAKRLHVGLQTFRELLHSLLALQRIQDDNARALFDMLLNNVCYVLEYRETILHLLMNYNESHSTKVFLRDVVETANIFFKMMEKFCKDSVVVQDKKRGKKPKSKQKQPSKPAELTEEELFDKWAHMASEMGSILATELQIPEEDRPLPFDATSDKSIDDQKEDCLIRIHRMLRDEQMESAVALLRAAREVWPEESMFGNISAAPEEELLLLREIFLQKHSRPEETQPDFESEESENEEYEDQGDNLVEKAFKFDDFAKRLLNPKIVRACTIVLTDWEQIPTKSLKAAVTILHRIAVGCCCPAMLYQAKLFRIFQQVLTTARDAHQEELRRLGIYVVRKFVEIAPTNPKIFAELLFYKSIKEANELEFGYCDAYDSGTKGTWTEEQENELRFLFEENQRNPETDKDVIDWIMENLADKKRTRRGILKKLKDMGLQFKAPTKKSTAKASNKNLWRVEEDEELRSLYDQYRTEDNCLQRILDEFEDRRTKQQIIKRMIQLHMIADKSEILPMKPRKKKGKKQANQGNNGSDDDENNEYMEEPMFDEETSQRSSLKASKPKAKKVKSKPKARKIVRTPLDVGTIRSLVNQVDGETHQDAIDWLKECLEEAADEEEEPLEEDDGVPLVPLLEKQKAAMEDDNFKKVLVALGIQPPIVGGETYWRIPTYLNSADLKIRSKILAGEEVEINDEDLQDLDEEDNNDSDNESEPNASDSEESEEDYFDSKPQRNLKNADDFIDSRKQKMHSLMFSKSDEETEERLPLKKNKPKKSKSKVKNKSSKDFEEDVEGNEEADIKEIERKLKRKKKNYDLSSEDEIDFDEMKKNFNKQKPSELPADTAAPPSNAEDLFDQLKAKRASKNKKSFSSVKQTGFDENEVNNSEELDELNFNSEDYRKRLLELGGDSDNNDDDDDDDGKNAREPLNTRGKNRSRRINIIDSDSDSNDGFIANKTSNKTSVDSFEQVEKAEAFANDQQLSTKKSVGMDLGFQETSEVNSVKAASKEREDKEKGMKINAENNNSNNKKRSRRILNESDTEDVNDNSFIDVRTSELGGNNDGNAKDNDEITKATKRKSMDRNDFNEPNDIHDDAADEDDEDALFLSRRKPTNDEKSVKANGEEPAKRRRIAIIDDGDDDEDDY